MKRCKTEPMRAPFNPEEADVFEARRALQNGDDRPLVEYVRDLAKLGNLLASQCNRALRDVPWDDRPATATAHVAIADESAEWDGSYLQVKEAIEQGNVELLGYFFREVAEFHDELAAVLSGRHYSQWRHSSSCVSAGEGPLIEPRGCCATPESQRS
jgi:hypothetical protein